MRSASSRATRMPSAVLSATTAASCPPMDGTSPVRSEWSDDCPGTVSIADLDGQLVASVPGAGWDIAWSPDGTRFATWLSFGETIGVYGVDGSLQAELDGSSNPSGGDRDPRWTPDGTALLLPAEIETAGITHYLVARLPLDGGEPEVLPVTDPLSIRSMSFSPDGTSVASVGPDSAARHGSSRRHAARVGVLFRTRRRGRRGLGTSSIVVPERRPDRRRHP